MFSLSVGKGYTGLNNALTVCEGPKQMRTLAGFVADAGHYWRFRMWAQSPKQAAQFE